MLTCMNSFLHWLTEPHDCSVLFLKQFVAESQSFQRRHGVCSSVE